MPFKTLLFIFLILCLIGVYSNHQRHHEMALIEHAGQTFESFKQRYMEGST